MIVRPAAPTDVAAITAIYGHHVLHGLGTFAEEPPSEAEMAERMKAVLDKNLPYVVAEKDATILGYAYAAPFRLRSAYRYAVEDSVYVAPEAIGQGVGRRLLLEVIEICEALGLHQIAAVIGDSGNAASIGLHAALGFERTGALAGMGFKHDRWVDVIFMQKALNGGTTAPPSGSGLRL